MHVKKTMQQAWGRVRSMGIRTQLMLFLCGMVLLVLLAVWGLCANLLQPRYNRYIQTMLDNRLEQLAGRMDDAIERGVVISRRGLFGVEYDQAFWGEMNTALQNGSLKLTNCCVDISDSTMFSVMYSENLRPCLLHESGSSVFGSPSISTERDTAAIMRLRQKCFQDGALYYIKETTSGSRQMIVGRTTVDGQYCVLISTSLAQVDEAAKVLEMLLPAIATVLGAIALAAAWLFSNAFARPLTRLSAAANEMARGNYRTRVPDTDRRDEVGRLSRDFNHMAEEVQRSDQLQRDILANVTHDLRTPLTLIKGYAETVRDLTGGDKARRDEQMNIIIEETDRLTALVNSVMELSKVSSGAEKCEQVRFDICQLCEEVADRYTALCQQHGWQLQLELPADAPLYVYADPAMIERVLHNLLGNATHHIGEDGVFVLRAKAAPAGGARIEVEDHGPGIPAEELPRLFDRYYRSRSDAGRAGTGLGLSITKAIFQQHRARFGVQSTLGQGSIFWFVLPDTPAQTN